MRFIPRVTVKQKDLDLQIVNIDKAVAALMKELFDGYLKYSFPHSEALTILEKGKIRQILYFDDQSALKGKEAKDKLAERLLTPEGTLEIVALKRPALNSLYSIFDGTSYFGVLHSSYIKFDGLLEQIHEDKLTGALCLDGEQDHVILYFSNGVARSIYFRGRHIKKGSKAAVAKLVKSFPLAVEFYTMPNKKPLVTGERPAVIEGKKETLYLQKVTHQGQSWFEDQYGNRYKKAQIRELWERYNLVL